MIGSRQLTICCLSHHLLPIVPAPTSLPQAAPILPFPSKLPLPHAASGFTPSSSNFPLQSLSLCLPLRPSTPLICAALAPHCCYGAWLEEQCRLCTGGTDPGLSHASCPRLLQGQSLLVESKDKKCSRSRETGRSGAAGEEWQGVQSGVGRGGSAGGSCSSGFSWGWSHSSFPPPHPIFDCKVRDFLNPCLLIE